MTEASTTLTPSTARILSAVDSDIGALAKPPSWPRPVADRDLVRVVGRAPCDEGVDLVGHRAEDDQRPDPDRDPEDRSGSFGPGGGQGSAGSASNTPSLRGGDRRSAIRPALGTLLSEIVRSATDRVAVRSSSRIGPVGPFRRPRDSVPRAVPAGRLELLAVGLDHLLGDVAGHVLVVIERRRERAAALGQ